MISNQEKSVNRISKLLQQSEVTWIDSKFSLHPKTQDEESVPLDDSNRLTSTDNQSALLGINSSESSASEDKQTSEKNKTSFADEMFADTLSNAPEELKERITVRESSTGDEQEENFVQTYDIDGKPSGISRIELFDAKSNEDSTRFVIDGSDVDAASSEQDKWESLAREYHKTHPDVKLYIGDESGIGFSTFKDAYEFRNWTETRQQETSGTSEAKQEAKSENEKSHKAGVSSELCQSVIFS